MSAAGTCSINWDLPHNKDEPSISYGYKVRRHLGDHFIMYVAVANDEVHAWVTVIGDADLAGKYEVRITIGKDELRTTVYRGRVHSIDEIKDTDEDEDGVVMSNTQGAKYMRLEYQIGETAEVEDDFILM